MSEKNLNVRLIVIGLVLLMGVWLIWPPGKKLRPGLDIAGGVSLMFEIDDTGLEDNPNLAEEMKTLLQKRVDPQGVYNLIWRVHGRNRIEVQMPLPPREAATLRQEYIAAQEALFASNIKRSDLEAVLRLPPETRNPRLTELAAGSANRERLMSEAARRYDEYAAAREAVRTGAPTTQESDASAGADPSQPAPDTAPALTAEELKLRERDAAEYLEDAIDAVLATNIDPRRFQDLLDLDADSSMRRGSLKQLKTDHPNLVDEIDLVIQKHAVWRKNRGFLDGPADLRRLLKGAGVLEFRILAEPSPENVTKYDRYRQQLQERGPRPQRGDTEGWFRVENPMAFFNLQTPAELRSFDPRSVRGLVADKYGDDYYVLSKLGSQDGLLADSARKWQLKRAGVSRDEKGAPCVIFTLDAVGGDLFRELTRKNVNKQLCIFLDGVAYSAANIQEAIGATGRITGVFSREKVNYLAQTMQAGALPARLKDTPLSERTIGSSLGETNLRLAINSGIVGSVAVVLLMAGFYLVCGLIANVALTLNVLLILAAMALLGARFTLDGIAGVILAIGMAVDANVLIYERMREEKARGSSLRMIIKNGYDKALRTILDSNVTTLLTCLILYKVGSEEVKGFGLTLGWGIALNLFTSVFVTRTLFILLVKYNLIKEIKMYRLIGVPKIDWYSKRKYFLPTSAVVLLIGMSLLVMRGARDVLDVEFLGGVNAEIELKQAGLTDVDISRRLAQVGTEIATDAQKLRQAVFTPVPGQPAHFTVQVPDVEPARLAALLTEPLEEADMLVRGGVEVGGGSQSITVHVREEVTAERLRDFVQGWAGDARLAGENVARASVGSVLEVGGAARRGLFWNVTTTETNKLLVQHALVSALGEQLRIQPRVIYDFRGDGDRPYPITQRRLEAVVPGLPPGAGGDVTDFLGGAAMYFDQLEPPQSLESIRTRLRNMRLQPGYQDYPWRNFDVIGISKAGTGEEYRSFVLVVADPAYPYSEDPERWASEFARKELALATATLDSEQTLRKVSQFKPQIASDSQQQASLALILSWGMIIAYLWVRFGRVTYGVAGVAALVHDVLVALAFVGFSGWLGGANHPIGAALLIEDFKINMPIVAALLTIIGFSINDTIVIFDRVRELRGRLGTVTPEIINRSINECMSRTILTSLTVFITLLTMYILGGSSIRGFNYCMLIGVISGTYSTIAIAAPLLVLRFERRPSAVPAAAPAPA